MHARTGVADIALLASRLPVPRDFLSENAMPLINSVHTQET
jgi:hypothetical protein